MRRLKRPRPTGRRKAGQPDPIDIHVGSRLRLLRTILRMSQEKLAAELGLTFQQVQKYERAANRISASRLYHLCRILGVRVGFFYEGLGAGHAAHPGFAEAPAEPFESDPLRQHETIELVEAYYAIGDPGVRRRLYELARALAANSEPSSDR
jgi:transcriptional regulator with XRE-family HTH domain